MALFRISQRPVYIPALGLGAEHFPCYANRRRILNAHDLVELTLVVSGRATCHLDDLRFAVGPGSLTAVSYGEAHCLVTEPPGIEAWNLYLDPRRMALPALDGRLGAALAGFLPMHPALAHRASRVAHLRLSDPAAAIACVRELAAELAGRPAGWQQAAALSAQRLLLLCARQALAGGGTIRRPGPVDAVSGRLGQVCACIDADPAAPHTLAALAELAGLSRAQLVRGFRAGTGLAPIQYVRQRRLERALGLLASTEDGVAAIALACGFADLSNFHHAFRRVIGGTPAAYRRRLRTEGSAGAGASPST